MKYRTRIEKQSAGQSAKFYSVLRIITEAFGTTSNSTEYIKRVHKQKLSSNAFSF